MGIAMYGKVWKIIRIKSNVPVLRLAQRPEDDTGIDVPEEIILHVHENEGNPVDKITGRDVAFNKPITDGGKGWFFKDTGESSRNIFSIVFNNKRLFEFLEKIEKT